MIKSTSIGLNCTTYICANETSITRIPTIYLEMLIFFKRADPPGVSFLKYLLSEDSKSICFLGEAPYLFTQSIGF